MRRLFLALLIVLSGSDQTIAAPRITTKELLGPVRIINLLDSSAFAPGNDAGKAHEKFAGNLVLGAGEMRTWPAQILPREIHGKDPRVFPGVTLGFITVQEDLVPITQDVIRQGSVSDTGSYWDMIVQPGRIWSEKGDGSWSRAAFPFALVNSLEGETHNGVALFLYRGDRVSNLRFQIIQQTSPFNVLTEFTAAGSIKASYSSGDNERAPEIEQDYRASLADRIQIAPWTELAHRIGGRAIKGFEGRAKAGGIVIEGLDDGDVFYLKPCIASSGLIPWCGRARFGVWSMTKSLVAEIALLRLAQKYGPRVFELAIRSYVREEAGNPEWDMVQFENAIDMATGMGVGSQDRNAQTPFDDMTGEAYSNWYESPSITGKIVTLLGSAHRYPWRPGEVMRYRDQDIFLLGVAMDRFLKSREGDHASIEAMVIKEVFRPIGIHYAPMNRTLDASAQPLMAFGFYPNVDDMVKIARLYQHDGAFGGAQILYAPRILEIRDSIHVRGLPTGLHTPEGAVTYFNTFWQVAAAISTACRRYYPRMEGWGGNVIALFPNGMNGIRIGKFNGDDDGAMNDTSGMAIVADHARSFCANGIQ